VVELVLRVNEPLVEQVCDVLSDELGALAVSVEDADADGTDERAIFGEPGLPAVRTAWARSTLCALFDNDAAATDAAAWLVAQDWAGAGVQLGSIDRVPDTDWVRSTQAQFAPVEINPAFWIVPSWHDPPAAARIAIRLDPGLAFGTGTHATTRMCLRWIARHARAGMRVLDYGCGSGILAIAAALHGAGEVDAVDIDPAAVAATAANARTNVVRVNSALPEGATGQYDLVVANILAKPLMLLAPLLGGHVAPAGHLVLAGLLERQVEELRAAYAPHAVLDVVDREEGWALLAGTKPGSGQ
jgi:ribosomal protein L11 methyltransferase